MSTDPRPEFLTRKEAAKYITMRPQALAVWAVTQRYDLPMVKIGNWANS